MFGAPREILPSWPKLSQSPILKLFGWGSPAHTAFEANRHLFAPAPLIQEYVATPGCPHCVDPYAKIPGLLAVHIRRGDFLEHCVNLAHWGAGFNAFNSFPNFPDPWSFPEGSEEERVAAYVKRCVPDINQIVEKVEAVRRAPGSEGLKNIYIMTNGDREWLHDLKKALVRAFRWEHIATSRDMVLTPEQKYVSQTMDMLIGERAQVFIGNGVSHTHVSFSANCSPSCAVFQHDFKHRYVAYGEGSTAGHHTYALMTRVVRFVSLTVYTTYPG